MTNGAFEVWFLFQVWSIYLCRLRFRPGFDGRLGSTVGMDESVFCLDDDGLPHAKVDSVLRMTDTKPVR